MSRFRASLALAVMCFAPLGAQEKTSTSDGVYSREQAVRGDEIYQMLCRSCHTPESHNGGTFSATWSGKPLAGLFDYIRERMPKNEPGTLSPQEAADVLAYLLRLNRMPQGFEDLPADTATLRKIRFETQNP
jgi:mono/diheme cytochrome c family protein